jgi:hypothetical protein
VVWGGAGHEIGRQQANKGSLRDIGQRSVQSQGFKSGGELRRVGGMRAVRPRRVGS